VYARAAVRRCVFALVLAAVLGWCAAAPADAAAAGWFIRRVPQLSGPTVDFAYTQPATTGDEWVQVACRVVGDSAVVYMDGAHVTTTSRAAGTYELAATCSPGAGDVETWCLILNGAQTLCWWDGVTPDPAYVQPAPAAAVAPVVSLDDTQWQVVAVALAMLLFLGGASMVGSWRS
jgi:hypothetical protein